VTEDVFRAENAADYASDRIPDPDRGSEAREPGVPSRCLSANGERLLTPTQPARCRVVSEVPPEIDGPPVGAVYNAAGCVFRQGVGLASFDVVGSLELNCAETSEYKPRLVAGLAVKAC
jgi:hypothetical protein